MDSETTIAEDLTVEDAVEELHDPDFEVDESETPPDTEHGRIAGNRRRIGIPVPYTDEEMSAMKDEVLTRLDTIESLEVEKKAEADRINGAIKGEQSAIKHLRTKISEGAHHEPVECELVLDWETKTRKWVDVESRQIVESEPFWDLDYQRDMFEAERENEKREEEAEEAEPEELAHAA